MPVYRFRSSLPVFSILLFATACTKIDTTRLGSDLIPIVDNVNTFDTLLDVSTRNLPLSDSTYLSKSELHAIGNITTDPLFGKTTASLYMETMPAIFPSAFAKDSLIEVDSIVLSLRYQGNYGDSSGFLNSVNFKVLKVTDPVPLHADTLGFFPAYYKLNKSFITGVELGSKFYPKIKNIGDTVNVRRDSTRYRVANQIRIVLNKTDAGLLSILRDSQALKSDTAFRTFFKGFKVEASVGGSNGALAYVNLLDTATRLEYYIRKRNGAKTDTTSVSYFCGSNAAHANNIVRNVIGAEIQTNFSSDSLLYIYTTPGSYGRISIPGLKALTNRIVHRAELKIIQIPDALSLSGVFTPPPYLYLDRFDTAIDKVKYNPIPFDLNPSVGYSCFPSSEGIDYNYFGGILPYRRVINGQTAFEYNFNLTRYVQSIVTRRVSSLDLRVSSAKFAEYFDCTGVQYVAVTGNNVAEGRVKVGGGATKNSPFPYKMQLRIIYSRL